MKGRRADALSAEANVVPFKGDASPQDLERKGRLIAWRLRPKGLPPAARSVWNRLGPVVAHPHRVRLRDTTVESFKRLCLVTAQLEEVEARLSDIGDWTYWTETRNGEQEKASKLVAQKHELHRQVAKLHDDWGLTPRAEPTIQAVGQGGLFDDRPDDLD